MKTILNIFLCLILFSCSSDDRSESVEESNNEIPKVEGSFKIKIEGVEKTVKNNGNNHYVKWIKSIDTHGRYYYGLDIYGFDQGFYFDFKIYTEKIELNKEYIYEHTNDFATINMTFDYSELCGGPVCSSYWGITNNFYGPPTGKIVITSFDGKTMSGTIETKVNHQYYGMTENQTRNLTEGVFTNAEKAFGSL